MLICCVVVPDGNRPHILAALRTYVEERINENGINRILGIGFEASSKRPYEALVVLDKATWTLPDDQ